MIELETEAARQQREAELVEAHALTLCFGRELGMQRRGESKEELAGGFHVANSIASGIDNGDTARNTAPMPSATTSAPKFSADQRVEVFVHDFATAGFPRVWKPATVTSVDRREDGKFDVSITRDDGAYAHQIVGVRGGNRNVRSL